MKKFCALMLAVALCVVFCACADQTSPAASQQESSTVESQSEDVSETADMPSQAPEESDKKLKIGFSVLTTDGFYITKYITRYNEIIEQRGYDSVMLDCKYDTATQAAQFDNLIAQKVDIIFLMPNEPKALIPSLQKAQEAKIPVIVVHQKVDPSAEQYTVGFAGADTVALGAGAGELMEKALNGKGNIVVLGGSPGSSYAIELTEGFTSKISDGIKILATGDHGWDRSKATTVTEDFLTKYDDLDGIWAMDDNTAIGAINAINAANRKGIAVVGINGQAEAFDYIKSGDLYGTVINDAAGNVDCAFEVLDLHLAGKTIPANTYSKSPGVTKENVDTTEPAF